MNIDKKSLVVGLLVGICLCLLFQFLPQAQAQVAPRPSPRYQMAANSSNFCVIDSFTGDVFRIAPNRSSPMHRTWFKLIKGPPR